MKQGYLNRDDRIIIGALMLFALVFRLSTIMMIHTGVDERDYWMSAKAIARGLPYPELSHRTTRYGVILPVALAQLALGSGPNVYYAMPILNCMLQAGLAYAIGRRLRGRITGFLAALALVLFPYMIRAGSQVRPEVFSITYMLLAMLCFIEYLKRDKDDLAPLAWTVFWLFISYEAKITNLFFVPGMMLAALLYKRRAGHAFAIGAALLALFLVETALYAAFTKYKFGELQIIMQNHFHSDSFTVPTVLDLLRRYSPRYLQAYWSLPFAAFAVVSALYFRRGMDKGLGGLILGSLSFFFFLTIAVKGLNPVTPAEAFINRYFSAALGPVFIVLAFAADGAWRRAFGEGRASVVAGSRGFCLLVLGLGAAASLVLFSLPGLPSGIRAYAADPLHPARHTFAINERYRREINAAYEGGTPIVAGAGLAGANALYTCSWFFIDLPSYRDGRPPEFSPFARDGRSYYVLSSSGRPGEGGAFLAARRSPFRVASIGAAELPALDQGDSPESEE
jgi:hypothetical protein